MPIRYPRIYSLSTVGIIQHYNQDYLLDSVRTDFTGPNGVGKSLIADLLQIILIADKSKIEFGTDSIKEENRQIHTLPYKTSDAYAFINVEISRGQFIVVGAHIRSKRGQPLRSFWILKKPYSEGDSTELAELTIPKEELILHEDFIINNTIPSIEEIAKQLRDHNGVDLRYFTRREDKRELLSFLYNQQVLPINLTIEENLWAFAKIIQSFSKAKTLNTGDDNSLKDFLFDNSADSLESQYRSHREDLDKLLHDYQELAAYITITEDKQSRLKQLKNFESVRDQAHEKLLLAGFVHAKHELERAKRTATEKREVFKLDRAKLEKLTAETPKLAQQAERAKEELQSLENDLSILTKYNEIYRTISSDLETIEKLSGIEFPNVGSEDQQELDISQYDQKEIVRRISHFSPIYRRYGTINRLNEKIIEQNDTLSRYKTTLEEKVRQYKYIIKLLSISKEDSLFSKLFKEQKMLSVAQETVLFSLLLDVTWKKPNQVALGTRYSEDIDLLDERHIHEDKDHNGYWINTGGLYHFAPMSTERRIFAKKGYLAEAARDKSNELQTVVKKIQNEIGEIDRFQRGETFTRELIRTNYPIDQDAKDFSALEKVRLALGMVQHLSKKITQVNDDIASNRLALEEQSHQLSFLPNNERLKEKLDELQDAVEVKRAEERRLSDAKIKQETNLANLSNYIPRVRQEMLAAEEAHSQATTKHDIHTEALLKAPSKIDIYSIDDQDYLYLSVPDLEQDFGQKREDYVTEYKSIAHYFDDTKSNVEIEEQLVQNNYVFTVLETALLGRVKHLERVPDALREANGERHSMIGTIHEAILNIFKQTKGKYDEYKAIVGRLNTFFKGKKISGQHYFHIKFSPHSDFSIQWINALQRSASEIQKPGELAWGKTVEEVIEDIFQQATNYSQKIKLVDLLDPKTYFTLETKFTDQNNQDKPGSTGESYSAIVLLGIGRLSIVQEEKRRGIKFLILEETANLDRTNFNTFPNIAEEFGYQMLTMTPEPYGSDSDQGWYLHCLLKGAEDKNINYPVPNSFFKTNESNEDLDTYLAAIAN